jgi:hypothetical protein
MNCLRTLSALVLSLTLIAGPTAAGAAEATSAPEKTPVESVTSPGAAREGGSLDRFTAVAAVVSIIVTGVAGVYLYGLIRKGL